MTIAAILGESSEAVKREDSERAKTGVQRRQRNAYNP
jgi:hypothetical protein